MKTLGSWLWLALLLLLQSIRASDKAVYDEGEDSDYDYDYEKINYGLLDSMLRDDYCDGMELEETSTYHHLVYANASAPNDLAQFHYSNIYPRQPANVQHLCSVTGRVHEPGSLEESEQDETAVAQALLEACLRNNVHFQNWPAPCYTTWLLNISQKVLCLSAKQILSASFRSGDISGPYLEGWVPSVELLKRFETFQDRVFEDVCVEGRVKSEEGIKKIISVWCRHLGENEMTLPSFTMFVAMWVHSLTIAWPMLQRTNNTVFDKTLLVNIKYDSVNETLAFSPFVSAFKANDDRLATVLSDSMESDDTNSESETLDRNLNKNFSAKGRVGKFHNYEFSQTKLRKSAFNGSNDWVAHYDHPSSSIDLRHAYKFIFKALTLDRVFPHNNCSEGGKLISIVRKHLTEKLIPMVEQKLSQGISSVHPINDRFKITRQKVETLKKLRIPNDGRENQWLLKAYEVLSKSTRETKRKLGFYVQRFFFWYVSMIVLAIGSSEHVLFDVTKNTLSISD